MRGSRVRLRFGSRFSAAVPAAASRGFVRPDISALPAPCGAPSRWPRICTRVRRTLSFLILVAGLCGGVAGCGPKEQPRLFVIGLDGATWEVIEPWIASGELPHLKALRDRSSWGTMNSVIPYLSPPAWTSATTGVNPGRHGIFDFQRKLPPDGGSIKVVTETANSRKVAPIWNMLKGRGPQVCIVNVPMTDPPDEVDGVMVAGMPHVDESGYTWPRARQSQLESMGYLIDRMEMKLPLGEEGATFETLMNTLRKRGELVKTLYQEAVYDLFWVVFTQTDRVQHTFWQFDDPEYPHYDAERAATYAGSIKKLWLEQDRILGEILALIPEDTWILVVSDHGFGPMHRELRVANCLHAESSHLAEAEAEEVYSLERSDAARLHVRQRQRDPRGWLTEAEARDVRDRAAATLAAALDPETGKSGVEAVYKQEDIYVGQYAELGPQLTILPARGYHVVRGDDSTKVGIEVFADNSSSLSGWHRMNGIVMLAGPGVQSGELSGAYNLLDVVPTCMYILDQAMPTDLDGKIMERCFTDGYRESHQARYAGTVSREERRLTPEEEEKLKQIPYIGG